jgi:hypothetical protein
MWTLWGLLIGLILLLGVSLLFVLLSGAALSGKISQLSLGGKMPNGVTPGGSGTFQVVWNGAIQAGATTSWSCSDPTAVLTPVTSDPTGQTVQVSLPANDTAVSFVLTATVINSVGATVTATATFPVNPIPPAPATAGVISQIA